MNPQRHADRVAIWIRACCLLALLAVAARVVQLQAYPGEDLRAAINARTSGSDIDPVRGDLLDRRGRVLSTSRVGWRVIVDPVAAGEHTDRVIVALSAQLGARGDDIGGKVMRAAIANSRRIAAGIHSDVQTLTIDPEDEDGARTVITVDQVRKMDLDRFGLPIEPGDEARIVVVVETAVDRAFHHQRRAPAPQAFGDLAGQVAPHAHLQRQAPSGEPAIGGIPAIESQLGDIRADLVGVHGRLDSLSDDMRLRFRVLGERVGGIERRLVA